MDTHFGNWLGLQIAEKGITRKEFVGRLRINETTLYRWLRDASPHIRPHHITRLANALGVAREDIARRLENSSAITA